MIVARNTDDLDLALTDARSRGDRVGFVPTMGALHEGHLSLVTKARESADVIVASVYLNPTQFRPGEDLDSYPANADRDIDLLERIGCDVAFLPDSDVVYPAGFDTVVDASPRLSSVLCGAYRGVEHFNGVTTVVARLFGIVRPDVAVFGEKDWQQCVVIERMTRDLFPSIELITSPTVRDPDGLAMSSRNSYLSGQEREAAAAIPRALDAAVSAADLGSSGAVEAAKEVLSSAGLAIEYLEVRDEDTLEPVGTIDERSRIFVAVQCGSTRLIDNQRLLKAAPTGELPGEPVDPRERDRTATEAATA